MESLDDEPADPDAEEAWAQEIKRRVDEVRSGKVKLIQGEEVEKEMAARLRRARKASMLPLDEQAALAQSLIANLEGKMDEEVRAAWDEEIKRRVAELDSGAANTIPWEEVRERNLKKLPHARWHGAVSRRSLD